jgi:hypothetical protein
VVQASVALVSAVAGGGWRQGPPVAHGLTDPVLRLVVPGRFDQETADVGVAGFGDRSLAA